MEGQNTWSSVACFRPPFAAWYALCLVFLKQSVWTKDETENQLWSEYLTCYKLPMHNPHLTLSIKIYWSELSRSDLGIPMFWVSNPVPKSQVIVRWAISGYSREGREGVKWELGLALLWTGKMGFTHWDWDLATGNGMNNYKMGMGFLFFSGLCSNILK